MAASDDSVHSIVRAVVDGAIAVQATLGKHFLERVYECALVEELTLNGLKVEAQKALPVYYRTNVPVATYRVDLLVEDKLIVEVKALEEIHPSHRLQILNYLKSSKLNHGLVLNFGPEGVRYSKVTLAPA